MRLQPSAILLLQTFFHRDFNSIQPIVLKFHRWVDTNALRGPVRNGVVSNQRLPIGRANINRGLDVDRPAKCRDTVCADSRWSRNLSLCFELPTRGSRTVACLTKCLTCTILTEGHAIGSPCGVSVRFNVSGESNAAIFAPAVWVIAGPGSRAACGLRFLPEELGFMTLVLEFSKTIIKMKRKWTLHSASQGG